MRPAAANQGLRRTEFNFAGSKPMAMLVELNPGKIEFCPSEPTIDGHVPQVVAKEPTGCGPAAGTRS